MDIAAEKTGIGLIVRRFPRKAQSFIRCDGAAVQSGVSPYFARRPAISAATPNSSRDQRSDEWVAWVA